MRRTRPAFKRSWLHLSWAAILPACGATPGPSGFGAVTDGGDPLQGAADAAPPILSGGRDGGTLGDGATTGPTADCSDAAKLVYVISDQNTLYSFAPNTLKFTPIGALRCPTSDTVNSMAVDRSGTAWVNFTDGKLYRVSTKDASCATTSFAPNQAGFTNELGMGFSSDSPGSKSETLFVSDNAGLGVAKVDLGSMSLTALGPYTGTESGANAELTGTGDARLFGFFATSPAAFAEIDKATAATPKVTPLTSVNASEGGYAFSFWGGDFWFYTAFPTPSSPDATTSVTHYVSATGAASVVLANIGFVIVGAGVSTCAPTAPPR